MHLDLDFPSVIAKLHAWHVGKPLLLLLWVFTVFMSSNSAVNSHLHYTYRGNLCPQTCFSQRDSLPLSLFQSFTLCPLSAGPHSLSTKYVKHFTVVYIPILRFHPPILPSSHSSIHSILPFPHPVRPSVRTHWLSISQSINQYPSPSRKKKASMH